MGIWTMCKTLTAKTIPKGWNIVGTVIFEENAKRNPHVIVPADVTGLLRCHEILPSTLGFTLSSSQIFIL